MIVLHRDRQTALASIAVKEVLSASYPANATAIAMEYPLLFPFIVIKITHATKVPRKLNSTFITALFR